MAAARSDIKTKTIDILVVGAGIGGTALASFLLLAQLKTLSELRFRITVLERSPSIQGHGQNIDIRGPGKDLLKRLGIDNEVRAATTGEEGAKFVDSAGKAWASFGVDKSGKVETGTGEIEILRGRLSKVLFERCKDLSEQVEKLGGEGIEFVFGESIDDIEQQKELTSDTKQGVDANVRVRFAKSQQWRAFDFVVGADGLQSRTRTLAWAEDTASGHASRESQPEHDDQPTVIPSAQNSLPPNGDPHIRPLGVYTAFYSIPTSLMVPSSGQLSTIENVTEGTEQNDSFDDGWRRWYHAPGRKSVMLRPSDDSSRLTVLMNILDLEHTDSRLPSAAIVKGDRKTAVNKQKELMREYFEDAGWECARLVEGMHAADDFYYDIVAQVKMEQWYKGRVCLLGDAAHCPSPFSGMGTTLALIGAYNLAGALTKQMSLLARQSRSSPPSTSTRVLGSSIPASSLDAAFSEYESVTRPIVTKSQKLAPGFPWIIHPQTDWGIWAMHWIVGAIWYSGLDKALARLAMRNKGSSKEDPLREW